MITEACLNSGKRVEIPILFYQSIQLTYLELSSYTPLLRFISKPIDMKPIISLCFFLCLFSGSLSAQSNYVEVSVTDTIQVKADYFVFRFNLNPDIDVQPDTTGMRTDPNYYRKVAEKTRQRQVEAAKVLEQKLKDAGFNTEATTLSDWVFRNSYGFSIYATTRDVASFGVLDKLMKTERGITCNLTQISSTQENIQADRLSKKLMDKARAKASFLAAEAKKKLLSVIAVSDKKTELINYSNINNVSLLASLGIDKTVVKDGGINPLYPVQGSLTVKFGWQ
ncbi:MAG: hypothetical protein V4450_04705 [Bacteroidota bacterium]